LADMNSRFISADFWPLD